MAFEVNKLIRMATGAGSFLILAGTGGWILSNSLYNGMYELY